MMSFRFVGLQPIALCLVFFPRWPHNSDPRVAAAVADGEAADLAVHRIVEVDPVEEQVSHAQSTAATPGPAVNAPTPPHKQRTNHPILSSTGVCPPLLSLSPRCCLCARACVGKSVRIGGSRPA